MGSIPMAVVLLLALFVLVLFKFILNHNLAIPSVAVQSTKEGSCMKIKVKLMFASVLETLYGLGVSSWVGYLLPKATLNITGQYIVLKKWISERNCF